MSAEATLETQSTALTAPVELPPLDTKFTLGDSITPEQQAFLDAYGFLHFEGVASPEEVEMLRTERDRVESEWLNEGRTEVNGIPLFKGNGVDSQPCIQRMPFTSMFSQKIRNFVLDSRFEPVRKLAGEDARVGHDEKDGVVMNKYVNVPGSVYGRLGWHTDGLRDLFYLRMPQQMLNVGMHLDRITRADGGLRLIPGTHTQGFFSMCFRYPHFVWHKANPKEVCVETKPGDLTVHDGRLWHRVARSTQQGEASVRRTFYVPYMTGPYEPKSEKSKTPFYHYLGVFMRKFNWKM